MGTQTDSGRELKVRTESIRKNRIPRKTKKANSADVLAALKAGSDSESSSAIVGSLIQLNTTYEFRLVSGIIGISSDSGGEIKGAVTANPTTANGGSALLEWTSLASLFSSFRLKSFTAHFLPATVYGSGGDTAPLAVGGNFTAAGVPASYGVVMECADAKNYNIVRDTGLHGYSHTIRPKGLAFSDVTDPDPGNWAGAPGQIEYYSDPQPGSSLIFYLQVEGIYEFRSRS
jgi:hypothetical protein